jgi:hypothetical protein
MAGCPGPPHGKDDTVEHNPSISLTGLLTIAKAQSFTVKPPVLRVITLIRTITGDRRAG